MSDFDKWFTEHVDDFVEGEYARFDCQLAWKAAMLHAAEVAKTAKPSSKDLSREEWIAVELTHEAIVTAIYNGLSN